MARKELAEFLSKKAGNQIPLLRKTKVKNGNAIGKLFIDSECKIQAKGAIFAKEEQNMLYFTDSSGAALYTKDGSPAAVKLTGAVIKIKSGHFIKIIEDNEHIRGFADSSNTYIASSLVKNPIATFHELKETYYAAHPEELPQGVNAHTYLRGCGADVREALKTARKDLSNMSADELIKYLKTRLDKERRNEAEFVLIRYNGAEGKKGIELIYGLQDKEFGVEANELFSDNFAAAKIEPVQPQAAPESQAPRRLRSNDEILFRDYFEDLFEKNMELFIILATRMMGTDKEKAEVLPRRNILVQQLLALTAKYESSAFSGQNYRELVEFANDRIARSVELIDANNEPAAEWCLFGAINQIADARLSLHREWLVKRKEYRARVWRNGGVLVFPQGRYRLLEGSKRTIVDRSEVTYGSLWEVMRSLFHQVDTELEDKRKTAEAIVAIDKALRLLWNNKVGSEYTLTEDERLALSDDIARIAASLVKDTGELKVEEKRIASLLLNGSRAIMLFGNRHLGSVKELLVKVKDYLKTREEEAVSIAIHSNNSGLNWVWQQALERDENIRHKAARAIWLIRNGRPDVALGVMKGITRLNELKNEPEYKTVYSILWPAINDIEKKNALSKTALDPLRLILKKYDNSRVIHDMLKVYRDKVLEKGLNSNEPADSDAILEEVFNMFARRTDLPQEPNPAQARARWWARLYQAVNIPIMTDDPAKRSERIPNPVFEAASAYCFILEYGSVAPMLEMGFIKEKKFDATRTFLEYIQKEKRGHITRWDLRHLVAALAKDYGLDADQARMLGGCVKIEDHTSMPAYIKAALAAPASNSLIKTLDNMRIHDDKNESFRLRVIRSTNPVYPELITIEREATGEKVGSVEIKVAEDKERGIWKVDLGLAQMNNDLNGVNYRRRGIFPRVLNLLGKVVPAGSRIHIAYLEETETLKTLAMGRSWYKTRLGKIFYRNGWKLETLSIFVRDSRGQNTYVAYDRQGVWKDHFPVDVVNFVLALVEAIKDINKTDAISGASVDVVLSRIERNGNNGRAGHDATPPPESSSAPRRQVTWMNIHGFADTSKKPLEEKVRTDIEKAGLMRKSHDVGLGTSPEEVRSHVKGFLLEDGRSAKDIVLSGHYFATISEYSGCIENAIRGICDALGTKDFNLILPVDLIDNSDGSAKIPDMIQLLAFTQLDKGNSLIYVDDKPVEGWDIAKPQNGKPVTIRFYTASDRMLEYLEKGKVSPAQVPAPDPAKGMFERFISLARALQDSIHERALSAAALKSTFAGKAMVLYADSMLDQGAMIDLEETLTTTGVLDYSTMIIYGKRPGTAQLVKRVIDNANRTVKTVIVDEQELIARSGAGDIYIDEAKELDSLIKYAGAKGFNNGSLLGVIKGATDPSSVDDIKRVLVERKVPVVSFESADGIYSFVKALGLLAKMKYEFDPKSNNWFAVLPPIKKLSVEIDKTYKEYQETLKKLLSSA